MIFHSLVPRWIALLLWTAVLSEAHKAATTASTSTSTASTATAAAGNQHLLWTKSGMVEWLSQTSPLVSTLSSVAVISLVPLVLLGLMPKRLPERLLLVLVSFALGTLLGDVFLHILPFVFEEAVRSSQHQDHSDGGGGGGGGHSSHSLRDGPDMHAHSHGHGHAHGHGHSHSHGHSHGHADHGHGHDHSATISIGIALVLGIIAFLVMDKLLSGLGGHGHSHHQHHQHHSHEEHSHDEQVEEPTGATSTGRDSPAAAVKRRRKASPARSKSKKEEISQDHHHHHHAKSSTGYLTILANIAHTMADGLTLAVAHYTGPLIGFSTTMAVFMHEVPHKLGDYAIMLQSGFSRRQALGMQLISSFGTVLGALVGCGLQSRRGSHLSRQDVADLEKLIIPFTAGGLLYTAMVGILPELLQTKKLVDFVLQLVSLLVGVALMAWIALME